MNTVVEMKNIIKMYGEHVVLDKVNLSIHRGEIYGLVGVNGAGKSTIMKIITGLRNQTEGILSLYGTAEKGKIAQERNKLGCLIENPALYTDMTARQNLEIQRVQRGLPGKKCVDDVLEIMGLENTGNKKVNRFSLGMKQRLGLAIALLGRPQLLILDEPINGLDPTKIKYVREMLKNLNREEGTTILISSHILSELHQLATVYGFLDKGRMLQQITDKELDEYCKKHVYMEVDNAEKTVCFLDENYKDCSVKVYPDRTIRMYGYKGLVSDINAALVKAHIRVESIGYKGESLETYFTNLLEGSETK